MDNLTIKKILSELASLPADNRIERLYELIEQESRKPEDQIDMHLIEECTRQIDLCSAGDAQDLSEQEIHHIYLKHRETLQKQAPTIAKERKSGLYKRMAAAAASLLLLCCATLMTITAARESVMSGSPPDVLQTIFHPGELEDPLAPEYDPYEAYFPEGFRTEEMYLTRSSGQETLTYYTKGTEDQPYYQAVVHADGVEYVIACSDYDQLVAYMNDMVP